MNEKLKDFLDAKKDAEKKRYEEEKQKTLIELGLYEKVYFNSCTCAGFFEFFWPKYN